MQRDFLSTETEWERTVAYSRAVRVGPLIEVAGTTAMDQGKVVGLGDAAAQTTFILDRIAGTLEKMQSSLEHVIRTRIYVTDIDQWEAIGRVHGTYFRGVNPAATMVEVSRLIMPDLLVEIEATAWIPPSSHQVDFPFEFDRPAIK